MKNQFTGGGPILISDAKSTLVKSDQSTAAGVTSRALGIRSCPNVPYGDTRKGHPQMSLIRLCEVYFSCINRVKGAEPWTIPPEHPLSSLCRGTWALCSLYLTSPGPAQSLPPGVSSASDCYPLGDNDGCRVGPGVGLGEGAAGERGCPPLQQEASVWSWYRSCLKLPPPASCQEFIADSLAISNFLCSPRADELVETLRTVAK